MPDSSAKEKTQENIYWETFQRAGTKTHYGAVTCLDFSPKTPHDLYVANSVKVVMHSAQNFSSQRTVCDLGDNVRTFRCSSDGKLLLLGCDDCHVRLISTSILFPTQRVYRGHTDRVQVVDFHPSQPDTLLSSGDDKYLIQWDLMSSRVVRQHKVSEKFVHAGTWHGNSTYATGSYDEFVRFWDLRNNNIKPVNKFEVGEQIESLFSIPNTDLLVSAAGNSLVIFSTRANKILKKVSDHRNTISLVSGSVEGGRIFSGSADGSLNIYETQNFEQTHQIKSKKPISAFAISPSGEEFVIGRTTGKMKLYRRSGKNEYKIEDEKSTLGTYLCAVNERKRTANLGKSVWFKRSLESDDPEVHDLILKPNKRRKLMLHDEELKKLNYKGALEALLESKKYLLIVTLLNDLLQRGVIEVAMEGLKTDSVERLVEFVIKHIKNPDHARLAIGIGELLIKMYGKVFLLEQRSYNKFEQLRTAVEEELEYLRELTLILGTTTTILAYRKEKKKRENKYVTLWQ